MDMCNGPLLKRLIIFSAPLMLSGMLQLMFNAMDIIVVGRWAGDESLAAVGSTSSLNIVINAPGYTSDRLQYGILHKLSCGILNVSYPVPRSQCQPYYNTYDSCCQS